uniref:Uncharacterized protein n=1 Tax=Heliothis virescens TaxID=7102 RepID=A0A2A4J1E7_HELVI
MKSIILVALALAAVAVAAPTDKQPEILSANYEQQPDGTYLYKFQSDDGIFKEESGVVKEVLDEENKVQKVIVVKGSFSYPGEDGKPVVIQYVADEFQSDDGIFKEESGVVKEVLDEENKVQKVIVVKGSFSYPGEDGKPVVIQYVADEYGFHPEGDSIPKNPASRR